jgi:Homeodomain-like domain
MPDMPEKYKVELSAATREELDVVVRQTSAGVSRVRWAQILLMADESHPDGRRRDWEIAEAVGISERQVVRIRQKFVREGAEATLKRSTRSDAGSQKVLDGKAEAHLVRLACSTPPEGHQRWTLELLVDELCRLQVVQSVCRETVRKTLKKTSCSLGNHSGSASPRRTARGSSRGWKRSSMSTRKPTTKRIR